MAYKATYDKTANTFDRSVDQHLWDALMARSPLLDMVPKFQIDPPTSKFEWETANAPTRVFTEANSSNTDIDGSGSGTTLVLTGGSVIEVGSIIRNATRATPIGTYGCDEVMEVTVNSSGTLTVVRDAGRQNSGTGSTLHALQDTFEVIYSPKNEGSSPDRNKYTDVTLVENYTNIVDFYIAVTGSQAASARVVREDTLDAQNQLLLRHLQNELEGMLLYGVLNNSANQGSASQIRRTKGLDQFICQSGGNVDYTTTAVTEDALNAAMASILEDKTDPTDKFVIACHPQNARVISSIGGDKVVTTPEVTKWGRYIDTFRSDLGVDLPVIWTLNCSKSDLYIIDLNKVAFATFRPFEASEWSYGDDGVDAWRRRYLGEVGVKVVDGLYSHAKIGKISW